MGSFIATVYTLFTLILICCTVQVLSRTTVLEVSSTISKTRALFSKNAAAQNVLSSKHKVQQRRTSLKPFTFQLHSRVSVLDGLGEKDYKALTLSRLARDSARVESIQSRIDLKTFGINRADLKPVEVELDEEKLQVPVISGTSQGSGEYFSRIGIGQPPTESYMVLDTGSDVSWVQCAPCADCYQQADPIFDPIKSASFSPLACSARECQSLDVSECRNDTCLYEVSYGDGSYTVGDFVRESITFGDSGRIDGVAIGCGHNNEGLFVGAAGLIGLGGGGLSFPRQINASSFSYCLVDRDSDAASTLEFGPGPSSGPGPTVVTASMVRNPKVDTFYYVDLTGMSVGGKELTVPPSTFRLGENGEGGVILDSGTAVTRLPTEAYEPLRDAFKRGTGSLKPTDGVALFDTCYDLSGRQSVEVPTVSFRLGNGGSVRELELPAKNYLIPVDGSGTFCFAFAPTSSGLGIIGNVQQQGTRVGYDLKNGVIAFSPRDC